MIHSGLFSGRTCYVVFPVMAVLSFNACEKDPREHSFQVIEEEGVPIALTLNGPLYDQPPFRLEYILSINQREDLPASLLKEPRDFAPGPDSTLIVVEQYEGRAVVFDQNGEFVRELGGKGAGPGQFEMLQDFKVLGDSLAFYDRSLFRLTFFHINGSLLDVLSTGNYGRMSGIDFLPGGLYALRTRYSLRFDRGFTFSKSIITVVHGATGDTLTSLSTGEVVVGKKPAGAGAAGVTTVVSIMPFTPTPSAIVAGDDRILVTTGDRPDITLFDFTGRPVRKIRLDLPPRPVTAKLKEIYWEGEESRYATLGRKFDPSVKTQTIFPKHAGWWGTVIVDDAGYIWLQDVTSNPAGLPYRSCRFFVLDPEGRYLGNVDLPSLTGRILNGRYYAIVRNPDTGAEIPTVFRIVPALDGVTYP